MKIRPLESRDRQTWAEMRAALWPDEDADHLAHETLQHFGEGLKPPLIVLAAEDAQGRLAGFIELSLRPYAEGCASSPVPFVEGWYVAAEARHQGVGRRLVEAAENWARLRGFTEIGSDALLDNAMSHAAHAALGFEEVERIVCFRKTL
jgi:aminoglycoside 6'-N-acetyltransferase I